VNDRDGRPPVPLPRDEPVTQPVVDCRAAGATRGEDLEDAFDGRGVQNGGGDLQFTSALRAVVSDQSFDSPLPPFHSSLWSNAEIA